jgi:hypothetical protein
MTFQTEIASDTYTLYRYLESGASWQRLLPGWAGFAVRRAPVKQKRHDLLEVDTTICAVPCCTTLAVESAIAPSELSIIGVSGCYESLRITHRIKELAREKSLLTTTIHGIEARLAAKLVGYFHRVIAHDVSFHFLFQEKKKIVVAGASGLIGKELAAFLEAGGHEVLRLSRERKGGRASWDPDHHQIDESVLEESDAVINLAGESILGLWTKGKMQRIMNSRVRAQETLVNAVCRLAKPPPYYLSASAIGYYGSGDEVRDENSAKGTGFLPDVCENWEEALRPLHEIEAQAIVMRIGVVLSSHGGALQSMLQPARF